MTNTFVITPTLGTSNVIFGSSLGNKIVGQSRRNQAVPFFTDNFVGLTKNNSNGFTWGSTSNPSVVSFDGYDALKFRYTGSTNAEQRFDLGRNTSQLWIEYYIHIPDNFEHKDRSGQSDNNKWLLLWRDTYSDVTSGSWRCGWEFNPLGGDVGVVGGYESGSDIRLYSSRANYNSQTDSDPYNDYDPIGQGAAFISQSGNTLRTGQWNQVRVHVAASSNSASADGIQRMWVNGTIHNEITNGKFWNYTGSTSWGGTFEDCYIKNGYFLGAANSGYLQETVFHIRDVQFYDQNPEW